MLLLSFLLLLRLLLLLWCSCHFSCYNTSVRQLRRCPCASRGWFTNISGEYNYTAVQPPFSPLWSALLARGGAAVCSFKRKKRRTRQRRRRRWWTRKTRTQPLALLTNVCVQEHKRATWHVWVWCFLKPTSSPWREDCVQWRRHRLWLRYKQTAHIQRLHWHVVSVIAEASTHRRCSFYSHSVL